MPAMTGIESLEGPVIVTGPGEFADIDALAGCVAYAQLLRLQGNDQAKAVLTSTLNDSVTRTVRGWHLPYEEEYTPNRSHKVVLVDTSKWDAWDQGVVIDPEQIVEVIDHNPSTKQAWENHPASIEIVDPMGAACSLVYRRICDAGMLGEMAEFPNIINALRLGIADNTLGLRSRGTRPLDREAERELAKYSDLAEPAVEDYFLERQEVVDAVLEMVLINDTKINYSPYLPYAVAQFEAWNAKPFLEKEQLARIVGTLGRHASWMVNIISIEEETTHFMASDRFSQAIVEEVLDVSFDPDDADNPLGVVSKKGIWQRKDMLRILEQDKTGDRPGEKHRRIQEIKDDAASLSRK
jgi:nanoRNase/pAp phosphatase (c-di-AMP/oligoRNAs hydrolase)